MGRGKTLFHAGISSKFSSSYIEPYHDTTLDGATAARARTERKVQQQEVAIERQRDKIDTELRKIQAAKRSVQRRQAREARRILAECNAAACVLQQLARQFLLRRRQAHAAQAIHRVWLMHRARLEARRRREAAECIAGNLRMRLRRARRESSAVRLQCCVRGFLAWRVAETRRRERLQIVRRWRSAEKIQSTFRAHVVRETYLDIRAGVIQLQRVVRQYLVRTHEPKPQQYVELEGPECVEVDEEAEPHAEDVQIAAGVDDERLEAPPSPVQRELVDQDTRPRTPILPSPIRRNSMRLPKLKAKPLVMGDVLDERLVMFKSGSPKPQGQRQRRKTIAVTLSPMPYKTVLVQETLGGGSAALSDRHDGLRRKLLQRKELERRREQEKTRQLHEMEREMCERLKMEREERRMRMQIKMDRRRIKDGARRSVMEMREREEKEQERMEKEERASRVAWKLVARLEAEKRKPMAPVVVVALAVVPLPKKPPVVTQPRRTTMKKVKATKAKQSSNQEPEAASATTEEEPDWGFEFDELVDETQLASLIVT
ncbi:Aste57867_20713 [Aphanomyces stellatus]|uniref:Aste57867_20713 protein n=1 Tax=Aphanomyces stellatus TaxID=120398 RepID=A0A485LFR6_9STRA|nr:hypothetical protein As57867_020645 [Aphanomyces stellatus]VFT97393.1 Aste57867_20713 [Aphanomyces stellatus]